MDDGTGTFRPVRVAPRRKAIEYALNTVGGLRQMRAESRMDVVTLVEAIREAIASEPQPHAGYSIRFMLSEARVMHILAALDRSIDVLARHSDRRDGLRILSNEDAEPTQEAE
jgi:hypothetical protein